MGSKKYEGGLIGINQIKKSRSAESIRPITSSSSKLEAVTKEIIVYTEKDHTKNKSDYIAELYETYKDAILNLSDNIEVLPKKLYIAFKKDNRNSAYVHFSKEKI